MKTNIPAVISPRALAASLERDPSIRLLDVRTGAEFARGHVSGACNVPLDRLGTYAAELREVREPIVLVCRSGARARTAQELLRAAGMRNLHLLEGGMLAWGQERLPVRGRALSMRQVLGRVAGIAGVVAAVLYSRTSPLTAVVLAFLGLRMALGHSVLPCAAAGTCAVPGADTRAHVRALVDGTCMDADDEPDAAARAALSGAAESARVGKHGSAH